MLKIAFDSLVYGVGIWGLARVGWSKVAGYLEESQEDQTAKRMYPIKIT